LEAYSPDTEDLVDFCSGEKSKKRISGLGDINHVEKGR
jgi:hypothetical protein